MRGGRAVTVVRADGSGSAVLGCGAFSFDGRCLRHLDLVVRHRGEVLEGCCRFFDMVDEMRRRELGEEEEGLCRSGRLASLVGFGDNGKTVDEVNGIPICFF
jgi:hypothetical protein